MSDDTNSSGWLYLLRCGWHYKIGIATSVKGRVQKLQTANPYKIELRYAVFCRDRKFFEKLVHDQFAEYRTQGEWFELNQDQVFQVLQTIKEGDDDQPILISDAGDEENYYTYMLGDYVVRQGVRTPVMFWVPDAQCRDGFYLDKTSFLCEVCDGDGCVRCDWFGWITMDMDGSGNRKLGAYEQAALKRYHEFEEQQDNLEYVEIPLPTNTIQIAPFREGDLVQHATFGRGYVLGSACIRDARGSDIEVLVSFYEGGAKRLLQSFARLEKG